MDTATVRFFRSMHVLLLTKETWAKGFGLGLLYEARLAVLVTRMREVWRAAADDVLSEEWTRGLETLGADLERAHGAEKSGEIYDALRAIEEWEGWDVMGVEAAP